MRPMLRVDTKYTQRNHKGGKHKHDNRSDRAHPPLHRVKLADPKGDEYYRVDVEPSRNRDVSAFNGLDLVKIQ